MPGVEWMMWWLAGFFDIDAAAVESQGKVRPPTGLTGELCAIGAIVTVSSAG
jgi:hypothetical protein